MIVSNMGVAAGDKEVAVGTSEPGPRVALGSRALIETRARNESGTAAQAYS